MGTPWGLGLGTVPDVQDTLSEWGEAIAWGEANNTSDPKQNKCFGDIASCHEVTGSGDGRELEGTCDGL